MPSRPVVLGIVLFWVATLGWAVVREIVPWFHTGEAPPFQFDLEDEVGGRVILWDVFKQGERIGGAQTKISHQRDHSFDLSNSISFIKMDLGFLELKKVTDVYRVTSDGELRSFSTTLMFDVPGDHALAAKLLLGANVKEIGNEFKIESNVQGGLLMPTATMNNEALNKNLPVQFNPVPISRQGGILNILHPQHKVTGLFEGRSWTVPVFSPLDVSSSLLGNHGQVNGQGATYLATVHADELEHAGTKVACWRINVGKAGQTPVTRIWVRKADDLVLQQEANDQGMTLVLKRLESK